jgi:hypothetical protein
VTPLSARACAGLQAPASTPFGLGFGRALLLYPLHPLLGAQSEGCRRGGTRTWHCVEEHHRQASAQQQRPQREHLEPAHCVEEVRGWLAEWC